MIFFKWASSLLKFRAISSSLVSLLGWFIG
jgi:hypothetical protein